MRQEQLNSAYERLELKATKRPKRLLWLVIGIIIGIIVVVMFILLWAWRTDPINSYPYIPVPKNTVRSTSVPELIGNVILDTNDTAVEYSVISRQNLIQE
jgi:hypothetical protein